MTFDQYTIRPLTQEDLIPYFQLVDENRQRLEDFFTGTVSRTKTLEDARTFLSDIIQRALDKTYFPYVIEDSLKQKIAGFLDIKILNGIFQRLNWVCTLTRLMLIKALPLKPFSCFVKTVLKSINFKNFF